jgi:hypothetical protein
MTIDVNTSLCHRFDPRALTLEDQKVVLLALEEAQKFDDTWVVDTPHDLHLFKDVCTLPCQHGYTPSEPLCSEHTTTAVVGHMRACCQAA